MAPGIKALIALYLLPLWQVGMVKNWGADYYTKSYVICKIIQLMEKA